MEYFDLIMMILEHNLMEMDIDESDDDESVSDVFTDMDSDEEFTDFELQLLNNMEIDENGEFRF
tara:strand:+ start:1703 stop:1894 length:192 start_codon:yes stop_codon:yes gene_type:complete